jgi:hypothetical protein
MFIVASNVNVKKPRGRDVLEDIKNCFDVVDYSNPDMMRMTVYHP